LSYALLKNIKMLFKYIKNKGDKKNGSWIKYVVEG
jgi:hypothetical protein